MNRIESAEGAACTGGLRLFTQTSDASSTKDRSAPTADQEAGMEGALKLSGDFVRQTMRESGFVDIQANGVEIIETFTQYEPPEQYAAEVSLDPAAASEVATFMRIQMPEAVNQILRILAHVDPSRVATLLK